MEKKLKQDIINILDYFNNGLSDVESGSGEKQPMHKEIKSALKRLNETVVKNNDMKADKVKCKHEMVNTAAGFVRCYYCKEYEK